MWDKDFGGIYDDWLVDIQQTIKGDFIISGSSYSGISGNKTTPLWSANFMDYWIIKTDSLGSKLWEKDFGGTDHDEGLGNIVLTYDGGFLFSGESYSNLSGNKSENNLGSAQTWITKTDSSGNINWDKTIFTIGFDRSAFGLETGNGCYILANISDGNIGGYKTENSWNWSHDYWIIKFCDTTALPAFAFSASTLLCPGTCTEIANFTLNASTYQWYFPGAFPDTSTAVNPTNICYASPGSYDVQLIATNANGSDTLLLTNYITVYPSPAPQAISQSGDSLFAIAGSASYQWYFNGNIINGATDYFYVAQMSGDYNMVATDANGCEVEAAIFNVNVGLQSAVGNEQLAIFPNPVINKCTIRNALPIAIGITMGTAIKISIYNLIGEKILEGNGEQFGRSDILQLDCTLLPSGMYYLYINNGENVVRSKFVKQ